MPWQFWLVPTCSLHDNGQAQFAGTGCAKCHFNSVATTLSALDSSTPGRPPMQSQEALCLQTPVHALTPPPGHAKHTSYFLLQEISLYSILRMGCNANILIFQTLQTGKKMKLSNNCVLWVPCCALWP